MLNVVGGWQLCVSCSLLFLIVFDGFLLFLGFSVVSFGFFEFLLFSKESQKIKLQPTKIKQEITKIKQQSRK